MERKHVFIALCSLLCICLYAAPSFAQITVKEFARLMERTPELAQADKKLNEVWKLVNSNLSKEAKKELLANQREWLKSGRDYDAELFMQEGFSKGVAYAKATEERIEQLQSYINNNSNAKNNNRDSLYSKSEIELSDMLEKNIVSGNVSLVKNIISALNFEQGHLNNALYTASEQGQTEIIKYLLESGADAETATRYYDYMRPIDYAKNKETERVFIMHYTNTKKRLENAAQYGHVDIVKNIMQHATSSLNTQKAIRIAAEKGYVDILKEINPSSYEINSKDDEYTTAMHEAAKSGNAECVQYLIEKGGEVNIRNSSGETPLMMAKNINVMRVLLKNKANVNVRDSYGNTLLHTIQSIDMLLELMRNNVDINVKNNSGQTPLMTSIGNIEKVKFLLEKVAYVNVKAADGTTAMHLACREGLPNIVNLLIQYGANIDAQDNEGYRPIHYASFAIADPGHADPDAEPEGRVGALKILAEHNANINAKANNGETPLISFITSELFRYTSYNLPIVNALITLGADVNAQDNAGNTALHAIMIKSEDGQYLSNYTDEIKILLNNGANPAIKNNNGDTVIDIMIKNFSYDAIERFKDTDLYWEINDHMHEALIKK